MASPFTLAMIGFSLGGTVAMLRDETLEITVQRGAMLVTLALAATLLGHGSAAGWFAAASAIISAALAERAGSAPTRRRWWASPIAYPILILPLLLWGQPLIALAAAGLYATATLSAAIETLREKP